MNETKAFAGGDGPSFFNLHGSVACKSYCPGYTGLPVPDRESPRKTAIYGTS